jgi:hypothetical protein
MRIIFSGAEAEEHRLEAYEGLKSLDGLVRVATIAAHYAATGEVRFRAPYSDMLQTQLSGVQNGSFEFVFDQFSRFANRLEGAAARNKSEALFARLVARGTGQAVDQELRVDGEVIPPGDIDAMAEAAEAALVSSHRWINDNTKSISIVDGEDRVTIDSSTKEYIEQEVVGPEKTQDVTVAALNVNSKTGRVFFFDLGRTVAFSVAGEASPRTVANLSTYLTRYAAKTGETVNITYRALEHIDRRLKKIIIYDCFEARDAA